MLLAIALAAAAPLPADNGAKPTVDAAEEVVKSHLNDPYSAHFVWPYDFAVGPFKWPLSKTQPGYFTCGKVNAKNRMGGYTGENWFFIQIRDGAEVMLLIDSDDLGYPGAEVQCRQLIKAGRLTALATPVRSDPH